MKLISIREAWRTNRMLDYAEGRINKYAFKDLMNYHFEQIKYFYEKRCREFEKNELARKSLKELEP